MGGSLSIPLDFTVEFLLLIVALGAAADAFRGRRAGAKVQAFGWLFIALAQGMLGGQILAPERAIFASLIRGVGYLILFVAPMRVASVGAIGAFAIPPMAVAFGPAALAAGVASRGWAKHRKDQEPTSFAFMSAFVLLACSELLIAMSLSWSGGETVEHVLRGVGALLLARWLTASLSRSIRLRFIAGFVAVLTIGIIVIGSALNVVIGSTIESEERARLATIGGNRVATMADLEASVLSSANFLAQGFSGPLEGRGSVVQTATQAASLLPSGADVLLVIGSGGRVQAAVERRRGGPPVSLPAARSIPLAGSDVVAEARRGREASSPMRVSYTVRDGIARNELVLLGAAPVFGNDRREILGALAIGYRIDREAVGQIATDTGSFVGLILGDGLASSAAPTGSEIEPVDLDEAMGAQVSEYAASIGESLDSRTTLIQDIEMFSVRYLTVFTPILRADQVPLGMLVFATRADALDAARRGLTQTLFLITLLTTLVAAVVAWAGGGRITRPLLSLTAASRGLRAGDLGARATISTEDEVGALGEAFNEMASDLETATTDLRASVATQTALSARLEAILQSMGDALIATDPSGVVTTLNHAAEGLLGKKTEQVSGRMVDEVIMGDGPDGASLGSAVMSAPFGDGLLRSVRGTRLISFASTPLTDEDGNSSGRVIVLRDVTETRQAERMKDEFLANVSHELRTPLTPIMGFAEMMTRREMPREKSNEYLNRILESSQRLERIVDILVDFAAIEAGRMAIRTETIPVRALLKSIGEAWEIREPDRDLTTRVARGVVAFATDVNLVRRSIDELIDNALRFSEGPVRVIASLERQRSSEFVRISIIDRGPGISDEQRAELFSGFRQLDGSETREVGGLGLGLAFVQKAILYLGGRVEVESEGGKGSTFSIVFPVASKKASAKAGRAIPGKGRTTQSSAPRVPRRGAGSKSA